LWRVVAGTSFQREPGTFKPRPKQRVHGGAMAAAKPSALFRAISARRRHHERESDER